MDKEAFDSACLVGLPKHSIETLPSYLTEYSGRAC